MPARGNGLSEAAASPVGGDPQAEVARVMRALHVAGERLTSQHLSRRYQDHLHFLGQTMRRMVFDAERFLAECESREKAERFDFAESRHRWLSGADDPKGGDRSLRTTLALAAPKS